MAAGKTADQVTSISTEENPGSIRIIDFGVVEIKPSSLLEDYNHYTDVTNTASWIDKRLTDHIQPEHLRAPEVYLGAPWGPPVDIWSLGCLVRKIQTRGMAQC